MRFIAQAAVVLHSMVVEARRGIYSSDGASGVSGHWVGEEDETDIVLESLNAADVQNRLGNAFSIATTLK